MRPSRVGGQGKPVRVRRGPATVTGEALRTRATEARAPRFGKARSGRPGSQETCPDRQAIRVLAEGNGSMQNSTRRLAGGLLATGLLAAPAVATASTHVTVRVEGRGSTVLKQT